MSHTVAPYGTWESPITAARVAAAQVRPGFIRVQDTGVIWWSESRPAEDGRATVVRRAADGTTTDVLPPGWSARSTVHEYGGRPFLPVGDRVVFTSYADQRLYVVAAGETPVSLTPVPAEPAALRYAEPVLAPDGTEVWCVRESHDGGRVRRSIVAVPLDGSAAESADAVRQVVAGSDFVASPRPSPDGRHLAWIAWDHPRMPWDGSELRVGTITEGGTVDAPRTLLGGPDVSVLQPEWADAATLYAVADPTGWWNLLRVPLTGTPVALCPREEEFGGPLWVLGCCSYAVLADGRLAVLHGAGEERLGILDPASGSLEDIDLPFRAWAPVLHATGSTVVGVAGSPTEPDRPVAIEIGSGALVRLGPPPGTAVDPAYLPTARVETLPGPGGRDVHALVYPPANPAFVAPVEERPPYVVFVHGGPTGSVKPTEDLTKAYFTSRGIGVIDVNYGGSSGYGRAYRERLRGQWGIIDVEDCVAAVRALVDRGEADGARLAIRGGSAGGWTTLAALTRTTVFAAGTSYYGVAELLRFAEDTHDFESRYLDGLIGTLPADRELYVERAPLSHVEDLSCPVLLLQGLEDRVVPPSQSEMFRNALQRKGIRHAYITFEGEQHGFRKAATVIAALEAELSLYGQVLGFDAPGVPVLPLQ